MQFSTRLATIGVISLSGVFGATPSYIEAVEVRYRGVPAELVISEISEHTLKVVLAPIDETRGEARPAPPSPPPPAPPSLSPNRPAGEAYDSYDEGGLYE